MKPRERRERGEQDLFRSRLDQIINMDQELVRLAKTMAWRFIEERCGAVYADGPGMPPLPTRLMAGLAILKHTFDLSDEELCARWIENPHIRLEQSRTFSHGSAFLDSSEWELRLQRKPLNLISGRHGCLTPKSLIQGRGVPKRAGQIYFGGRRKPRHGFSRSHAHPGRGKVPVFLPSVIMP